METTLSTSPIAEYKTQKAAINFASRVIGGAAVIKSEKSAFDMYWPVGKAVFQVYPARAAIAKAQGE